MNKLFRRSDAAPACKICMDGDITMVLLPCRHLLCCERCAEQLKKCPWCRSSILGTLKTFLLLIPGHIQAHSLMYQVTWFGITLVKNWMMCNMEG